MDQMENPYHLVKAVLLLDRMENPYHLAKVGHHLDQMENLYHLGKVVLVTLDLAVPAVSVISVDLVDHRLNKRKLQERLLRQL